MAGRPRVLIVDDEPSILVMLQLAFQDRPWHVEVVTAAEIALERHRKTPFHVLLVDKNLPDMSGIDLVRRLRDAEDAVPVIVITGFATAESAVEGLNLRIHAYMEKPFRDVFAVARTVESALAPPPTPGLIERLARLAGLRRNETESAPPAPAPAAPPVLASATAPHRLASATVPPSPGRAAGSRGGDVPLVTFGSQALPVAEARRPDDRGFRVLIASADPRSRAQLAGLVASIKGASVVQVSALDEIVRRAGEALTHVIVLHGALDVIFAAERLRADVPEAALIVLASIQDLRVVTRLIELGVRAVIDQPLDSPKFEHRFGTILRGLRADRRRAEITQ